MLKHDFVFSIIDLQEYLKEKGWDLEKVALPSADLKTNFFLLIPKYYIDKINWYDNDDPLRKMVLTSSLEQSIKKHERTDPIGDKLNSPVPGIVHRHSDRCLLMLTNSCAVHCRFCFRRSMLATNKAHFEQCMQYIENHLELWEVILSGGDPFMLTDSFLQKVIARLQKIKHIKTIRFHTRVPAVYPQRITPRFIRVLKKAKPCTVVIHINHPREVTKEFITVADKLRHAGMMLLSQSVLMKEVNDTVPTLELLFRKLVAVGIKPYYLHHLDLTQGTDHFRVPIEKGKTIMKELRRNISGVCLPEYVIDNPEGQGKVPVMWLNQKQNSGKL